MNIAETLAQFGLAVGPTPFKLMALSIPSVGAGMSMAMLQLRMRQRRRALEERMAGSLSAALRSGAIDFNLAAPGTYCNALWIDDEDTDDFESHAMPTRYQLLGYERRQLPAPKPKELPGPPPGTILRVRLLGEATSSPSESSAENLFLGMTKSLLKPGVLDDNSVAAMIPPACTRFMSPRRALRSDTRGQKKAMLLPAYFQGVTRMAGLKVGLKPQSTRLSFSLKPATVRTRITPTGLEHPARRIESAGWQAPSVTLLPQGNKLVAGRLAGVAPWPEKLGPRPIKSVRYTDAVGCSGPAITIPQIRPVPAIAQLPTLSPRPEPIDAQAAVSHPALEAGYWSGPEFVLPSRVSHRIAKELPAASLAATVSGAAVQNPVLPIGECSSFAAPPLQQGSHSTLRTLIQDVPIGDFVPAPAEAAGSAPADARVEPFRFTPPMRMPRGLTRPDENPAHLEIVPVDGWAESAAYRTA